MNSITSANTIENLRNCFAVLGILITLISDNGPQMVLPEFQMFLKNNGVMHLTTAPYLSSNGQAERYIQIVTAVRSVSNLHGDSLKITSNNFLSVPTSLYNIQVPTKIILEINILTELNSVKSNII